MANEIQTITVPDFVGATGSPFFAVSWPDYYEPFSNHGVSMYNLESLTAEQAAIQFETEFNNNLPPEHSDKTISVAGTLDGTSLVLTVEFDGAGIANTNVDPGEVADFADVGFPVIATVQDGGPDAPAGIGHINHLTMGCG